MSLVTTRTGCEQWQELRHLPNTNPNSLHKGINLGCAKCGALVLRDEEIAGIKNGSIWSKPSPCFLSMELKEGNNDELDIRCEECSANLGTYYLQKPILKDSAMEDWVQHLTFPSAKIMYLRQSSTGTLFNKTILVGDEDVIRRGIMSLDTSSKAFPN